MDEAETECPFCGETISILVDTSVEHQRYIEDCFVCCRPIQFTIQSQEGQLVSIETDRSGL